MNHVSDAATHATSVTNLIDRCHAKPVSRHILSFGQNVHACRTCRTTGLHGSLAYGESGVTITRSQSLRAIVAPMRVPVSYV